MMRRYSVHIHVALARNTLTYCTSGAISLTSTPSRSLALIMLLGRENGILGVTQPKGPKPKKIADDQQYDNPYLEGGY